MQRENRPRWYAGGFHSDITEDLSVVRTPKEGEQVFKQKGRAPFRLPYGTDGTMVPLCLLPQSRVPLCRPFTPVVRENAAAATLRGVLLFTHLLYITLR